MRTTITRGIRLASSALLLTTGLAAQGPPAPRPVAAAAEPLADGQRDFDFEFGSWDAHLRRLVNPLSGSTEWVEYRGLSVVNKVWEGRANLGEIMLWLRGRFSAENVYSA